MSISTVAKTLSKITKLMLIERFPTAPNVKEIFMLFRQDRTTLRYIAIFGILASFFLISVFFFSCDRIQQVVAPHEAATLMTRSQSKLVSFIVHLTLEPLGMVLS